MPVATVDPNEYERKDLKSAPPDGYVMVRPLPYGMALSKRDKAQKMYARQEPGKRPGPNTPVEFELATLNELAMQHDFAYCIGEHNLTDPSGMLLDFTSPMVFKQLDPRIGAEIEQILAKINGDIDEEELEDFTRRRGALLSGETTTSVGDSGGLTEVQTDSFPPPPSQTPPNG